MSEKPVTVAELFALPGDVYSVPHVPHEEVTRYHEALRQVLDAEAEHD